MSRSKTLFSCGAIAFALCAGSLCQPALAIPYGDQTAMPSLSMSVDGENFEVSSSSWQWDEESDVWTLPNMEETLGGATNGATVSLTNVWALFDPALNYTFAVTDFGLPSVFSFSMSTPIAPTGPSTIVTGSLSAGLTDFTGDGVSITPTGSLIQSGLVGVGLIPNVNMGVDVGPAAAFGPGLPTSYPYGAYSAGPLPGPVNTWNSLGVSASFLLSGGNDTAALTGIVTIVPEPSSIVLVAMGALALAVVGRRRRSVA